MRVIQRITTSITALLVAVSLSVATSPIAPANTANTKTAGTVHVPILMYHYVRDVTDPKDIEGKDLSVSPNMFKQQLDALAEQHATTITLDDLYDAIKHGTALPPNPVILTFDDGYEDFYTTVFPELQSHNMKATAHIVTGFLDKPAYLTTQQVIELSASPLITIAAHTVHHVDLRRITINKITNELIQSKKQLETITGNPVYHMAYPSGRWNTTVVNRAAQIGYHTATTTAWGRDHAYASRLTLTRVRVHGEEPLEKFKESLWGTKPAPHK